ncbi:hypothetical protein GQ54DRAFT_141513 [Martensiomyces pterosporus]|nr:hypothetical protein GQ54DRAFT_141513 [Martensiomyces pterosporus]
MQRVLLWMINYLSVCEAKELPGESRTGEVFICFSTRALLALSTERYSIPPTLVTPDAYGKAERVHQIHYNLSRTMR